MSWLLQLKVWALGIQLRNKEKRILSLESNVYALSYPRFSKNTRVFEMLRGC